MVLTHGTGMFMMMDFMPMLSLHLATHFGGIGAITLLAGDGTLVGVGDLAGAHLGDGDHHGAAQDGTDQAGIDQVGDHHGADRVGIDQDGDHHGAAQDGTDQAGVIIPITIIDVLLEVQILVQVVHLQVQMATVSLRAQMATEYLQEVQRAQALQALPLVAKAQAHLVEL